MNARQWITLALAAAVVLAFMAALRAARKRFDLTTYQRLQACDYGPDEPTEEGEPVLGLVELVRDRGGLEPSIETLPSPPEPQPVEAQAPQSGQIVDAPAIDPPTSTGDDIQPVRCQVCRRVLRGKNSIHHGAGRRCRARIRKQRETDDADRQDQGDAAAERGPSGADVPGAEAGEPAAAAAVPEQQG